MADHEEASMALVDEEKLWNDLHACTSVVCDTHEAIDDALRKWLDLSMRLRENASDPQDEVVMCGQQLLSSQLFTANKEYVRKQIIYSLLQEDDTAALHCIACLLLLDGHREETLFPRMIDEVCFPRLLELINERREDDPRLHQLLLQLMYEMSRMERLRLDDITLVDDSFIHYLFRIIEGVSDDVNDPYHYPTIRVLLVLNEQYMLASTDTVTGSESTSTSLTNRIVKCLSLHGPSFRTFGENIILLLNRETETSLQLLILKLLYLLFTTKATYEYFYTNDLRVLLDVIIRNLMDLPDEKNSLRHTYLRVLYPLLAHTQLSHRPHYKKDEILRALSILRGSHNNHFAPADETTLRLVHRVAKVPWLDDAEASPSPSGEAEVARRLLGMNLSPTETGSTISVGDVAGVMEKPGVQTPSRNGEDSAFSSEEAEVNGEEAVITGKKTRRPLPAVPKHRHGVPIPKAAPNGQSNGQTNSQPKRIPPKTPPPRRWGKMKKVQVPPVEPATEWAPDHEA